jgi:hypothetical protein
MCCRQRRTAGRAGLGVVVVPLVDRQRLRTPVSGRTGTLPRSPLLRRRVPFARGGALGASCRGRPILPILSLRAPSNRRCSLIRWPPIGVRSLSLPGRPAARRARAVVRILIEPLVRRLQIRQQPRRQHPQLLLRQRREVGFVELREIVSG